LFGDVLGLGVGRGINWREDRGIFLFSFLGERNVKRSRRGEKEERASEKKGEKKRCDIGNPPPPQAKGRGEKGRKGKIRGNPLKTNREYLSRGRKERLVNIQHRGTKRRPGRNFLLSYATMTGKGIRGGEGGKRNCGISKKKKQTKIRRGDGQKAKYPQQEQKRDADLDQQTRGTGDRKKRRKGFKNWEIGAVTTWEQFARRWGRVEISPRVNFSGMRNKGQRGGGKCWPLFLSSTVRWIFGLLPRTEKEGGPAWTR